MPYYTVTVREIRLTSYTVNADTIEAACEAALNGEGTQHIPHTVWDGIEAIEDTYGKTISVPDEWREA